MNCAATIAACRRQAGFTQAGLAARAGTSQAALSMYERGEREPSVATLRRLLRACGHDLAIGSIEAPVRSWNAAELERRGRLLEQVVELAAELPARHSDVLRYPPLPRGA